MPRLSAAREKLPISATVMKTRDGLEIMHFRASILFTQDRTVRSFSRCLSHVAGTIGSVTWDQPSENASVRAWMNRYQAPEDGTFNRGLWGGRIMSAFVVIALVANSGISFRAATDDQHVARNRVRDGPDPRHRPDHTRLCHSLRVIPATTVLGAILVTGFLGGGVWPMPALASWGRRRKSLPASGRDDMGRPLYARPSIRTLLPLIR